MVRDVESTVMMTRKFLALFVWWPLARKRSNCSGSLSNPFKQNQEGELLKRQFCCASEGGSSVLGGEKKKEK